MGAFFAIIAIVFGLPILYAIGWIIIAAVYGTKEGAVPKLRELSAKRAQERLSSHPNEIATSIDQTLCNDMLDFFYGRVRFYCDSNVDEGAMEEYKLSSMAYSQHRQTHNNLSSRLVQETARRYGGCYFVPPPWEDIKSGHDIMFVNLQKVYQTSTPREYYEYVDQHMGVQHIIKREDGGLSRYSTEDFEQAYNSLAKVARISSDLHSIQLHCYLLWMQYEPTHVGWTVATTDVPRHNPSFADDLYNRFGVRPANVKTLYDYKMQVLRKRLRDAGISGIRTYMQSGGISQVDYTKT